MSCESITYCDFCGNPTRREPGDGERLCWGCHVDAVRRLASLRRAVWQHAVGEAARLIQARTPGLDGRVERAAEIVLAGDVQPNGTATLVRSQEDPDRWYQVAGDGCQCPDYVHRQAGRGVPCKHIIAVRIVRLVGLEVV